MSVTQQDAQAPFTIPGIGSWPPYYTVRPPFRTSAWNPIYKLHSTRQVGRHLSSNSGPANPKPDRQPTDLSNSRSRRPGKDGASTLFAGWLAGWRVPVPRPPSPLGEKPGRVSGVERGGAGGVAVGKTRRMEGLREGGVSSC